MAPRCAYTLSPTPHTVRRTQPRFSLQRFCSRARCLRGGGVFAGGRFFPFRHPGSVTGFGLCVRHVCLPPPAPCAPEKQKEPPMRAWLFLRQAAQPMTAKPTPSRDGAGTVSSSHVSLTLLAGAGRRFRKLSSPPPVSTCSGGKVCQRVVVGRCRSASPLVFEPCAWSWGARYTTAQDTHAAEPCMLGVPLDLTTRAGFQYGARFSIANKIRLLHLTASWL